MASNYVCCWIDPNRNRKPFVACGAHQTFVCSAEFLIQFDTFKTEPYDRNYDMVESAMNKHSMREQDME